GVRAATAGAGAADERDRRRDHGGTATGWLRRRDRGGAHLHDDPRYSQTGVDDDHLGDAGRVPAAAGNAGGIHGVHPERAGVSASKTGAPDHYLSAPSAKRQTEPFAPRPLAPTQWNGRTIAWGAKTYLMAVVNATPDSFSGDGVGDDVG